MRLDDEDALEPAPGGLVIGGRLDRAHAHARPIGEDDDLAEATNGGVSR